MTRFSSLQAVPVPGIKIFKFEAPLYFANMENFKAALVKATNVDPHYLKILKEQMKDTDMALRHSEVSDADMTLRHRHDFLRFTSLNNYLFFIILYSQSFYSYLQ